ncbi:MAG: TonB-dependent receptor [Verrucomicrobiota bacterium]
MKHCAKTALILAGAALIASTSPGQPAGAPAALSEFKKLSLEELLDVKVTSVSRRAENASRAAAAVEVVTAEQIERTGAASLQDALRLATGVQVSGFGGHSYAISSRGFTSLAANKLQVMQDGRSLYSPLFSGVFWDAYAAMLEDIDRVEVIRGPGATMWGANAVNGVVNIISKDASATQGTLVSAGGGSEERAFGAVRYGGKTGQNTHYRVYGRFHNRDGAALPSGADSFATPSEQQAGFRVDSRSQAGTHLTVQGDYFENEIEATAAQDSSNRDINLLGRWTRQYNADTEFQLQSYYDHFERNVPGQMRDRRNTFDLDSQYRSRLGDRHEIIVGANYRVSADHTGSEGTAQFVPDGRTTSMAGAFVQDEITLVPQRFSVVLGSKFQWDSLDGFQPQPNLRALWTPDDHQTVWAAVARAVRMPTRIDEDLRFVPMPATGVVFVRGNPDFKPEKLNSFELGYRVRPIKRLYLDVTAFAHDYDDLRSLEPSPPLGIPLVQYNRLDAQTRGVEVAVKFEVAKWWQLSGNYSYLDKKLKPRADSNDPNRGALEGNDAPRLFSLWSAMDLPKRVTLDTMLRHVGTLPVPVVPSYTELDVRIAWRPNDAWQVALVGQNLLDRQHLEFGTASPTTSEMQRGYYVKGTWRF